MDGVIVEYKGKNMMRIIESAADRQIRTYHETKRIQKANMNKAHPNMMGSVHREPIRNTWCDLPRDTKCWKNRRHAKKNWMRHLHRLKPSIRNLIDNCIYPNVAY